jgi:hypothetical protein
MSTSTKLPPIIPQEDAGLKLAERPVKQLLVSYFSKFDKTKILSVAHEVGLNVAYFRIPGSYIAQEKIIKEMLATPEMLDKTCWYYIPPRESVVPLEFKQIPRNSTLTSSTAVSEPIRAYEIYLYCFSISNIECNSPRVNSGIILEMFKSDFRPEVRRIIEGALYAAQGVFYFIKRYGGVILSSLTLDVDLDNLCLVLKDSIFPQYKHTSIIKYRIQEIESIATQ